MNTNGPHPTFDLSSSACWQLLRQSVVGRLAIDSPDGPDIFPVNHVVDHGSVVFRTSAGTKLFGSADRMVAFEVDGYDLPVASAWSVVLKGYAVDISGHHEVVDARRLPLFPWQAGSKGHYVRIQDGVISGRRFAVLGGVSAPVETAPVR